MKMIYPIYRLQECVEIFHFMCYVLIHAQNACNIQCGPCMVRIMHDTRATYNADHAWSASCMISPFKHDHTFDLMVTYSIISLFE